MWHGGLLWSAQWYVETDIQRKAFSKLRWDFEGPLLDRVGTEDKMKCLGHHTCWYRLGSTCSFGSEFAVRNLVVTCWRGQRLRGPFESSLDHYRLDHTSSVVYKPFWGMWYPSPGQLHPCSSVPHLGCLSQLLLSPVYAQDGSDFMVFLPTGSHGQPTAQDERRCVRLQTHREIHCKLMSLSHKQKGPGARAPAQKLIVAHLWEKEKWKKMHLFNSDLLSDASQMLSRTKFPFIALVSFQIIDS